VAEASLDEFDRFFKVNVKGTLLCVRTVSAVMKNQEPLVLAGRSGPREAGRGVIVNLGSCNSYVATPHIVQYTSSKHAVLGLTRNAGESIQEVIPLFCC
jgi:NAD(P)-dependent dehydrogenase (short-subunit alcohol dehydrogenase family)